MEIRKNNVYNEGEYTLNYGLMFKDDNTDITSVEIDMYNLLEIVGHLVKMVQYNYSGLVPDKAIVDIFKYIKHNIKFLDDYTYGNNEKDYMFKYKRGELKIFFANLSIIINNDGMDYNYTYNWQFCERDTK